MQYKPPKEVTKENYKAVLTDELINLFILGSVVGVCILAFSLVVMWRYGLPWAMFSALIVIIVFEWVSLKRLTEFTDWWVGKLKELIEGEVLANDH